MSATNEISNVDNQLIAAVKGPRAHLLTDSELSLVVERLLADDRANPNAVDGDGWTVLHHCAARGDMVCAALLLQYGADINGTLAGDGRTALHQATIGLDVDFIELLAERGADMNVSDRIRGWTALHYAVDIQCPRVVQVLVERGADKEKSDNAGKTPLQYVPSPPYPSQRLRDALEGRYDAAAAAPVPAQGPTSCDARLRRLEQMGDVDSQGNLRVRIIRLESLFMGRTNAGSILKRVELLEEFTGVLDEEH